jgi:hypothetical protein
MTECVVIRDIDRCRGPFKARSASDRRDDWPLWYVADAGGRINCIPGLAPRALVEEITACANRDGPCICGERDQAVTHPVTNPGPPATPGDNAGVAK